MVLIDSSIWIDFYNHKDHLTPEFDKCISLGQAATTDLIMTEVLQGFRLSEKKRYQAALSDLELCVYMPSFNKSIAVTSANNYRILRSKGITPRNTIDVYLATLCVINSISLLTNDLNDFAPMSEVLGLDLLNN